MKEKNALIEKWLKEFNQIKNELLEIKPFRNGTILKQWQTCNKIDCKCRENKNFRHWPYYSWTKKVKGKTVTVIVPETLIEDAKSYVDNAKLLKEITSRMSALSDKIIRKKIELAKKKKKIKKK